MENVHHLLQLSKPAASKPGPDTHLLVFWVCRRTNSFSLGNVSLHVFELQCLLLQAAFFLWMSQSAFDRKGDISASLLAPHLERQCNLMYCKITSEEEGRQRGAYSKRKKQREGRIKKEIVREQWHYAVSSIRLRNVKTNIIMQLLLWDLVA